MQIDPHPEIEMGPGRIATGWFEHSSGQLWELWIDGSEQPIRGTEGHPIWSNDRLDWVPLSELKEGESVQVQGGYAKVQRIQETEDVEKVYTLEIDADHCYRVGQQGLLVHNASIMVLDCDKAAIVSAFSTPGCGGLYREALDDNFRATLQPYKNVPKAEEVIYLVADSSSGAVLKVGENAIYQVPDRYSPYVRAAEGLKKYWKLNRTLRLDFVFTKCTKSNVDPVETALRDWVRTLPNQKTLPWDNEKAIGTGKGTPLTRPDKDERIAGLAWYGETFRKLTETDLREFEKQDLSLQDVAFAIGMTRGAPSASQLKVALQYTYDYYVKPLLENAPGGIPSQWTTAYTQR